jgi:hypothetical protein
MGVCVVAVVVVWWLAIAGFGLLLTRAAQGVGSL